MSLINDALKRASGSQPPGGNPPPGGPPMQPVQNEPRSGSNPMAYAVAGLIALLIIGASGWLLKNQTSRDRVDSSSNSETTADPDGNAARESATAVSTSPAPEPVAPSKLTVQPKAPETQTAIAQAERAEPSELPSAQTAAREVSATSEAPSGPAETVSSQSVAAVAARAPVEPAPSASKPDLFPSLKLQAIYYRLKGPTVLINGKTRRQGQDIDGAKIISIQRHHVIVDFQGEQRYLTLN